MLCLLLPWLLQAPPAPALDSSSPSEAADLLSQYLQIDTRNLPAQEIDGARFLGHQLARAGIPYEIDEFEPGRANLMARIEGDGSAGGPICLLSHIDTVDWELERWQPGLGPLSGTIQDGYIWGRGALDMKGMGIVELQAFIALSQQERPLTRDVLLLAVADEEAGNSGAKHIVEHHWEQLQCAYVFNEGGLGIQDLLFPGQTVYPISVGEKGVLWVRLTATGDPGHGSTPKLDTEAPEHLIRAVNAVRQHNQDQELQWHPAMVELMASAGADRALIERVVLTHPWLLRRMLRGTLNDNPITRASMTTTWHLTGLEGARAPNVVPGSASAVLDIRLFPGMSPEQALAELAYVIADESVEIEVLAQEAAAVSEWRGDPVYQSMVRHLQGPGVVVGPAISPGFTDSVYFRAKGARAYGMVPFSISQQELTSFHGPRERLSVQNLEAGIEWMSKVLLEIAS